MLGYSTGSAGHVSRKKEYNCHMPHILCYPFTRATDWSITLFPSSTWVFVVKHAFWAMLNIWLSVIHKEVALWCLIFFLRVYFRRQGRICCPSFPEIAIMFSKNINKKYIFILRTRVIHSNEIQNSWLLRHIFLVHMNKKILVILYI
jgi:hypothetical protein